GIFSSRAELEAIHAAVSGDAPHPMKDGYKKLQKWPGAAPDFVPDPAPVVYVVAKGTSPTEDALRDDAHSAYAKAIETFNAWSRVFKKMDPDDEKQVTLESAWVIPVWCAAAEIIRRYGGNGPTWEA